MTYYNILKEEIQRILNFEFSLNDLANDLYLREEIDEIDSFYYNSRLTQWASFFELYYSKSVLLFKDIVVALIELSSGNQVFNELSIYELEISFSFFEKLFNSKKLVSLKEPSDAKKLLMIALFYGKYTSMQIRPFTEIHHHINKLTHLPINDIFSILFVKYENPTFLTNYMEYLTLFEFELLVHLLKGNNIRTFPSLPFKISKLESFIMMNHITDVYPIKSHFTEYALIFTKLIKQSKSTYYIADFFDVPSGSIWNFKIFMHDINYWEDVYNFLETNKSPIDINDITNILDYINYQKLNNNSIPIKEKTLNSLLRDVNEWHDVRDYSYYDKLKNKEWQKSSISNSEINHGSTRYFFEEIITGTVLYKESTIMRHCVYSYIADCLTQKTAIWSVKIKLNQAYKHQLTVEVRNNEIVQVVRPFNEKPSKQEFLLIEKWAKENGLTVYQPRCY